MRCARNPRRNSPSQQRRGDSIGRVRGRDDPFYDFATKYLDDVAELDVPAKIDDDVSDAIRDLAIRAFRAIDCEGLARVDFFLTDDGR
ncbi:D-ala D-ala ligase family protein [Mycobacterium xenopi 3993]|nr:D-ala D-ala ligase family protein [Mycobacterium xenopi 3993]